MEDEQSKKNLFFVTWNLRGTNSESHPLTTISIRVMRDISRYWTK